MCGVSRVAFIHPERGFFRIPRHIQNRIDIEPKNAAPYGSGQPHKKEVDRLWDSLMVFVFVERETLFCMVSSNVCFPTAKPRLLGDDFDRICLLEG